MSPHTPICVPCGRLMQTTRMGICVQVNDDAGRGYYKVQADEKRCPNCGKTVLSGFGEPAYRHHASFGAFRAEMEVA